MNIRNTEVTVLSTSKECESYLMTQQNRTDLDFIEEVEEFAVSGEVKLDVKADESLIFGG